MVASVPTFQLGVPKTKGSNDAADSYLNAGFDVHDVKDMQRGVSWLTGLLLRLFARRLNREVFYPVLARAHERRIITSRELHSLHSQFDPTQRGLVGRIYRDGVH